MTASCRYNNKQLRKLLPPSHFTNVFTAPHKKERKRESKNTPGKYLKLQERSKKAKKLN
jgi:hypothetical protein